MLLPVITGDQRIPAQTVKFRLANSIVDHGVGVSADDSGCLVAVGVITVGIASCARHRMDVRSVIILQVNARLAG